MVGQVQGCVKQAERQASSLGARAWLITSHQKQVKNLLLSRQAWAWLVMASQMGERSASDYFLRGYAVVSHRPPEWVDIQFLSPGQGYERED
jgi:hypothetical protein